MSEPIALHAPLTSRVGMAGFTVGIAIVAIIAVAAIVGNQLVPHDPFTQDLGNRLKPPFWMEGTQSGHLLGTEIVPNIASHLAVVATLEMALAILLEAALSFLGLGVPPPLPSWGLMIAEGKDYMFFSPWVIMVPGVALFVLVLGINLVGDGLRNLLGSERSR